MPDKTEAMWEAALKEVVEMCGAKDKENTHLKNLLKRALPILNKSMVFSSRLAMVNMCDEIRAAIKEKEL